MSRRALRAHTSSYLSARTIANSCRKQVPQQEIRTNAEVSQLQLVPAHESERAAGRFCVAQRLVSRRVRRRGEYLRRGWQAPGSPAATASPLPVTAVVLRHPLNQVVRWASSPGGYSVRTILSPLATRLRFTTRGLGRVHRRPRHGSERCLHAASRDAPRLCDQERRAVLMTRPGEPKRVTAFGRGRVCTADGCTTVLSEYNPSAYCVVHAEREATSRARRSRSAGSSLDRQTPAARQCARCEEWFDGANPRRVYCSDHCRVMAFYARKRRSVEEDRG